MVTGTTLGDAYLYSLGLKPGLLFWSKPFNSAVLSRLGRYHHSRTQFCKKLGYHSVMATLWTWSSAWVHERDPSVILLISKANLEVPKSICKTVENSCKKLNLGISGYLCYFLKAGFGECFAKASGHFWGSLKFLFYILLSHHSPCSFLIFKSTYICLVS